MPEAYDYVAKGEELAAAGRIADAERAFEQAIRIYEKADDREGVWYAIGRFGAAYEDAGDEDRAIEIYRQAVKLGTDIPATLHALVSILVDRGDLDEAFAVAASWDKRGYAQVGSTAFAVFIGLGQGLSREDRHEEATALLTRTVDSIPLDGHSEEHWSARGVLGQILERAGRLGEAMRLWADAIAAGSADRNTYTRYLINLERQKEYETELRIIERALQIQHDAAWELDLRKRQQRVQAKVGSIPKEEAKKTIPAFSVCYGEGAITLTHQVKLPVQAGSLAVSGNVAYVTTGGKSPALTVWDIDSGAQAWRVELPESVHGVLAAEGVVITHTQTGPVGTCETILRFYDHSGEQLATVRLPDATSQMVIADDLLYAGCRNGKLYVMTLRGEHRWSFMVPGSTGSVDSPYMRPCPYLVTAGKSLVVFSSWQNVYALTSRGQMAWHWTAPEHRTSSQAEGFTITISTGPDSVRSLAVAPDGSRVLVAAGETLYVLENGEVVRKLAPGESIDNAEFLETPIDWIVGSGTTARIYNDGKQRARFDIPQNARLASAASSDHIVASFDRRITVVTLAGKRVAEIEFAKSVVGLGFGATGQLVVGAGQLIVLAIGQEATTPMRRTERRTASEDPISVQRRRPPPPVRPAEEAGLPVRWFEGTRLGGGTGKALYQGRDGRAVTIEQLALEQYKQLGFEGLWSENEYWWTIISLLYWDVLFARLPDVFSPELGAFPGPLQDMPRDLFTSQFFARRRDLIGKREAELCQGSMFGIRKPNPEADLRNCFARHHGIPCRSANWERFSVDQLAWGAKKLTPPQLCKVMCRLLENFNDHRSGVPDLFLWRADQPLFVEVKSRIERLSDGQIAWMSFLAEEVRVPVEICRVAEQEAQRARPIHDAFLIHDP